MTEPDIYNAMLIVEALEDAGYTEDEAWRILGIYGDECYDQGWHDHRTSTHEERMTGP